MREKAKCEWLKWGDCNSIYFHATLKSRKVSNKVNLLHENGEVLSDEEAGRKALETFSNLFGKYTHSVYEGEFYMFDSIVSEEENEWLARCPSEDEIFMELNSMNQSSAPGLDGFTSQFYITFWDVIKNDLVEAIKGFFEGLQLPTLLSSTLITLIPKDPNASDLNQLRPISLCNCLP